MCYNMRGKRDNKGSGTLKQRKSWKCPEGCLDAKRPNILPEWGHWKDCSGTIIGGTDEEKSWGCSGFVGGDVDGVPEGGCAGEASGGGE